MALNDEPNGRMIVQIKRDLNSNSNPSKIRLKQVRVGITMRPVIEGMVVEAEEEEVV